MVGYPTWNGYKCSFAQKKISEFRMLYNLDPKCDCHPDYDGNKTPETHCTTCWDLYDLTCRAKMFISQSQHNREELKTVWKQFQDAGYEDITFTCNISSLLTEEQAVAEVLNTLKNFLANKTKKPSTISL